MQVTNMLDWIAEHIPQLILTEPFSGLFGLLLATYIIGWLFGFNRK